MHVRLKTCSFQLSLIINIIISTSHQLISSTTTTTTTVHPMKGDSEVIYTQEIEAHERHENGLLEIKFGDHLIEGENKKIIKNNRCKRAEGELDSCSAQLLAIGLNEATFPYSMDQLNTEYCPKIKKLVKCIKTTSECYSRFDRQIIDWILTSTRKLNLKRCKLENEKLRFLRLTSSCFSQMKKPMERCMRIYIGHLETISDLDNYISRLTENDRQIQMACCANRKFKQCILNNAKHKCKPFDSLNKLKRTNSISSQRNVQRQIQKVAKETMDDLEFTLEGLTGPSFICKTVKDEFCKVYFDGKIASRSVRHKSIVVPLLKIYSNP